MWFGVAFFCTLALIAMLCGFAAADHNSRSSGFGEFAPLAQVELEEPLSLHVSVLGLSWEVSLEGMNAAAGWAQKGAVLLPPSVRLGAKLTALGLRAWENLLLLL